MQKKIISMILAIAMVLSMFAGITIAVSAASTVTLTFAGGSGTNGEWTFADEASDISAVFAKGTHSSNEPRLDATCIRFYGTATMSNTMTVSGPVGCNITGIAFVFNGSYNNLTKVTATAGTLDNDAKTWAGSASTIVFTTTAQLRIESITVTYEASDCSH